MDTLYGTLRLRPTRIGFLVRPTDRSSVRRIMQLCTCLWGGIYNPIIPVCGTLPRIWRDSRGFLTGKILTRGYLDFFEPDVFVEASVGLAKAAGIDESPLRPGKDRIVLLDEFVSSDHGRRSHLAFGLSIADVYEDLYQEIFQFNQRRQHKIATVIGRTNDDMLVDAVFGGFPTIKNLSHIKKAFEETFESKKIPLTASSWRQIVEEDIYTPLHLTEYNIDSTFESGRDPVIFIFDPSSTSDLIDFWNLRQFQQNVLPVSIQWAAELRDFLRSRIIKTHRPLPGNRNGVMIRTTVEFARSIKEEDGKRLAEQLFNDLPGGSWSRKHWYEPIWNRENEDHVFRPHRARLAAKESNIELKLRKEDQSIRFTGISPKFASRFGDSSNRWVNVVSLNSYRDFNNLALTLPAQHPGLNRIRLGGGLLSNREGFILLADHKDQSEYWNIPSGSDAISNWLAHHHFKVEKSDPGRVADQIIAASKAAGRTSIFEDKDTLLLLDKMAKSIRTDINGTIYEYPDRTAGVEEWKQLIRKRGKQSLVSVSLDDFVKAGVLKLGISLECSNCRGHNWYGLDQLGETLKCGRCLQDFSFPQGSLDFKKTPWRYRVVGPFSVPDFAGGAYATLLSLRVFFEKLGHRTGSMTFSTNLELKRPGERPIEIDFALWSKRSLSFHENTSPQLVVGEAKSFAKEAIREEDVTRMKRVALQIPGTVLAFSMLKDTLSPNEKKLLRGVALWGRMLLPNGSQRAPVIILTGRELFSPFYVSNAWEEAGGASASLASPAYINFENLVTFADLTQQLYLDLEPFGAWNRDRGRKRQGSQRKRD